MNHPAVCNSMQAIESRHCPFCNSQRIWKDGIRYTKDGELQRFICREKIRSGKISLTELVFQPEQRKQRENQVGKKDGKRNNERTLGAFEDVTKS